MKNKLTRCSWVNDDPLYIQYHDTEWGVPIQEDQPLFELLILEGMQAGLSWYIVLKKREHFRQSFDQFQAEKIARYTSKKVDQLMQNPGIIRHRLKIESTIVNAKAYLRIQQEHGSFAKYLWEWLEKQPATSSKTAHSEALSKLLKKQGFKFVGGTICYAFMQAAGMVCDHSVDCYRYAQLTQR